MTRHQLLAQARRKLLAGALCLLAVALACGQQDPLPGPSVPASTPSPADLLAPTPTPPTSPAASYAPASTPSPAVLLTPTPTPQVPPVFASIDPVSMVSPSLDGQIFDSTTIVRASLLSASAGTESVPSGAGVAPTYRVVNSLRFTAHEYLKGSGPAQVTVVVRADGTFATAAEALAFAQARLGERTTTWDDRQGILFLRAAQAQSGGGASSSSGAAAALEFTLSNYEVQTQWDYSIDTLSRAWLPASVSAPAGEAATSTAPSTFIIDGSASPPPVVTLSALRSKISAIETTLRSGEGIAGFRVCIAGKIYQERHRRAHPWSPLRETSTLSSGSAAGTEVSREVWVRTHPLTLIPPHRGAAYDLRWLSGPDMDLFQARVVDNDTDPSNGYDQKLFIARPLPAGSYRVHYNSQHHMDFPCNYKPTDAYDDWTVTVTAPSGTLHEAMFDPAAASGGAVGFSASVGTTTPATFTVGGSSTRISSLLWRNGSVVLTLSPYASLAGQTLDFIALDGSVSSTLAVSAATVDAAAGALTWSAASQPWRAGDKLMLRIRGGW